MILKIPEDEIRKVGGLGTFTGLRSKTQVPRSSIFTQRFFKYFKARLFLIPTPVRCCKHNDCVPSYWSHCFVNNKVNSLCLLVSALAFGTAPGDMRASSHWGSEKGALPDRMKRDPGKE